jgi:hypothetical protein
MKRFVTCAMVAVVVLLLSGAPASAQQPGHQHGPGPAAGPAGADHRHMDMCRQMMGQSGMMGGMGGMMGMMPMTMGGGDPRQQAEMMAMRGEMMKAMGDIMIK